MKFFITTLFILFSLESAYCDFSEVDFCAMHRDLTLFQCSSPTMKSRLHLRGACELGKKKSLEFVNHGNNHSNSLLLEFNGSQITETILYKSHSAYDKAWKKVSRKIDPYSVAIRKYDGAWSIEYTGGEAEGRDYRFSYSSNQKVHDKKMYFEPFSSTLFFDKNTGLSTMYVTSEYGFYLGLFVRQCK